MPLAEVLASVTQAASGGSTFNPLNSFRRSSAAADSRFSETRDVHACGTWRPLFDNAELWNTHGAHEIY